MDTGPPRQRTPPLKGSFAAKKKKVKGGDGESERHRWQDISPTENMTIAKVGVVQDQDKDHSPAKGGSEEVMGQGSSSERQGRHVALRISRLGKKQGKKQLAILRGYLRAEGKTQPVEIRAMLDSGATGEFMARRVAEMMGAKVTQGNFGFAVEAFGKRTALTSKVVAAELSLPGVNPRTALSESLVTKWDFIVAERLEDSYDLILGLEFMRKFGARFAFNHDPAQITFTNQQGRDVTVREEEEHRESEREELGDEKFGALERRGRRGRRPRARGDHAG